MPIEHKGQEEIMRKEESKQFVTDLQNILHAEMSVETVDTFSEAIFDSLSKFSNKVREAYLSHHPEIQSKIADETEAVARQ